MHKQAKLAEGAEKTLAVFGLQSDDLTVRESIQHQNVTPAQTRPRWVVPTLLLIATLLSMTWAGIVAWSPMAIIEDALARGSLFEMRRHILANWYPGLLFSVSLALILGAHELGHYFATKLYGIRSTLPIFIPFPINPAGTCGAVIMMDGSRADRKQIFDIGLAGPLAGLVFAIPIAALGMVYGNPPETRGHSIQFGQPLIVQWISNAVGQNASNLGTTLQEEWPSKEVPAVAVLKSNSISNELMNPLLMAAWVGFLVTGLNMVPISQLDGGHVIFGLLGERSRIVAWAAYLGCIAYVGISYYVINSQPIFILMLLLIPLMGIAHPPSRNDFVEIGPLRQIIGTLSLTIPLWCIPLRPIILL
jgi:membrane-associated protease RseP (regulator of RpoE activity)